MKTLNKTLQFAVQFARFSAEMGIPPQALGQMIAAARDSVRCYERNDNVGENRNGAIVEEIAALNGCEVDWPGLWPCIQKRNDPSSNQLLPSAP